MTSNRSRRPSRRSTASGRKTNSGRSTASRGGAGRRTTQSQAAPPKKAPPKGRSTKSRRKKVSRMRRTLRKAVLLTVVVGALVAAWLIWPFWTLSGQFGSTPQMQPSRLYGQPLALQIHQRLDLDGLTAKLTELGYSPAPAGSTLVPGTWVVDGSGQALEVFRRRFPTPGGLAGGDRLRVELAEGRIQRLSVVGAQTPNLATAHLDPPLVASFLGDDLRDRRPVRLDDLSEDVILAVLAAEDSGFLEHTGVSPTGILRAAWINFRAKGVRQGGSTLTQQLVKNLYLTHERRWTRKVREALLAVMLELRYSKRAILEAYLNEIYWGRSGTVHLMGVGAASRAYFGKDPAHLSLAESAQLAGMIQSPARYSPFAHPDAAKERRDFVLGRLVQLEWISKSRWESAVRTPLASHREPMVSRRAPYFSDAVRDEARRRFGIEKLEDAGYTLHSTLSMADQRRAEDAVRWGIDALEKGYEKDTKASSPLQAALVSIDPSSGAIRSWVGGRDYASSQFDRVSSARRQAGSAFKPIVFAAAFETGRVHPATYLDDSPYTVQLPDRTWTPQNSSRNFRGRVTVRTVLEQSLNVPTARLAYEGVGLDAVIDMARRLGIQGRLSPFPAISLGAMEVTPLELATVYGTLASGGMKPTLHTLAAVTDRQGKPVQGQAVAKPTRVLDENVAFLVNTVLEGVLESGTARKARQDGIHDALAGKTGTTNSRRDSWFAGYSPDRATLVWVGYDDNSKTRLSGARAALPIWSRFTLAVRPGGGYRAFPRPAGVVLATIDPLSGGLATTRCPSSTGEYFLRSAPPQELCELHSGLRARPLEQPEGVEVPDERGPIRRWLRALGKRNEQRRH